jgi:hypothetical protein
LLTSAQHLPLRPALLLALTAALVFLLLVAATKVVAGTEYIVYFHHEVAILASGATLLWALGVPALPYLDITAIAVLVFLGFGRAGCLIVGCCHGRPTPFGVCYGTRHVAAGFPGQLAGVTLAPVQSLESITAFALAGFGAHLALMGAPGSALEWCLLAYGAARSSCSSRSGAIGDPRCSAYRMPSGWRPSEPLPCLSPWRPACLPSRPVRWRSRRRRASRLPPVWAGCAW